MINDYLKLIPKGEVRTFFYSNHDQIRSAMDQTFSVDPDSMRLVAKEWDVLPSHHQILRDILESLSLAVAGLWPDWYGQTLAMDAKGSSLEARLVIKHKIDQLKSHLTTVCIPWLEDAADACLKSQRPIFNDKYSDQIQLTQLALALEPDDLVLLLLVKDLNPSDVSLRSLAQLAVWFASLTRCRVAVLLWKGLADRGAIDSINYQSVALTVAKPSLLTSSSEETKAAIWPIKGKPHPHSPGEQALYRKISTDKELSQLFSFNQKVSTGKGRKFLVDLLWPVGQVVVEIDGYQFHSKHYAFIDDRNRDYELLISGYLVLRLSHDEVVDDVEIATEKIRDVVRFRQTHMPNIKEN